MKMTNGEDVSPHTIYDGCCNAYQCSGATEMAQRVGTKMDPLDSWGRLIGDTVYSWEELGIGLKQGFWAARKLSGASVVVATMVPTAERFIVRRFLDERDAIEWQRLHAAAAHEDDVVLQIRDEGLDSVGYGLLDQYLRWVAQLRCGPLTPL